MWGEEARPWDSCIEVRLAHVIMWWCFQQAWPFSSAISIDPQALRMPSHNAGIGRGLAEGGAVHPRAPQWGQGWLPVVGFRGQNDGKDRTFMGSPAKPLCLSKLNLSLEACPCPAAELHYCKYLRLKAFGFLFVCSLIRVRHSVSSDPENKTSWGWLFMGQKGISKEGETSVKERMCWVPH
jgi:hypothetical protein